MTIALFEVEVKNRLLKGLGVVGIFGTQGNWYHELIFCLAESETEAAELITQKLAKRPMLGISKRRRGRGFIRREIKILNVKKVA